MKAIRTQTIALLLSYFSLTIDNLAADIDAEHHCQKQTLELMRQGHHIEPEEKTKSDECRTFYYGLLIKSLQKAGYHPLPQVDRLLKSVERVRADLQSVCAGIQPMKALVRPDQDDENVGHVKCCPAPHLEAAVKTVRVDVCLSQTQVARLSQQATKLGLLYCD